MGITARRNYAELDSIPLSGIDLMAEIGDMATRIIRTRTERGISSNGAPFQPLSARYAAQKQKALGHSRADLTVSGRMLNDMGPANVTETGVDITFRSMGGGGSRGGTFIQRSRAVGAADKAMYHDQLGAGRSHVKREFFDLTEGDVDQIQAAVESHLDRVLA